MSTSYNMAEILKAFSDGARVYSEYNEAPPPPNNDGRIPKGQRNVYLTRLAGSLVGQGITGANLEQHLRFANESRLEKKLQETEFQQILKSAGGWKPPDQTEPPLSVKRSPQLTFVNMADVMTADLPAHEFVVAHWIPRRLVTLLAGHGGMGKSYLALVLAAHVAAGEDIAGLAVAQGRVLFVSLEDEPRLVRWRLRKIIEVYNFDGQKVLENITLLDGTEQFTPLIATVSEGANAQPHFTQAHETVRQHAAGCVLVVIDNASDAFDANENARRHVRQFVHGLSSDIARESDAALLLLAHIDKNAAKFGANGNSYSGSTAWHNSCRSRLALVDEGGELFCTQEKMNLGPLADPVPISFGRDGVPVAGEAMLDNKETEEEDREALRACFQAAEAAQLTVGARMEAGNGSAMSALQTLPCYPQRFRSAGGKRKVPQLLNAMKADGALQVVEYTNNRNVRRKLVLGAHAKEQGNGPKPSIYRVKKKRVVPPHTP